MEKVERRCFEFEEVRCALGGGEVIIGGRAEWLIFGEGDERGGRAVGEGDWEVVWGERTAAIASSSTIQHLEAPEGRRDADDLDSLAELTCNWCRLTRWNGQN